MAEFVSGNSGDTAITESIHFYPGYLNPIVSKSLGICALPSLLWNPDRSSDFERYSAIDFCDHSGRRITRCLEQKLVTARLDVILPEGDMTVSRMRFMGKDIDGGWHSDDKADVRAIAALLGEGDFYYEGCDEPLRLRPGDVVRLDNRNEKPRHKAVSLSNYRVVLVEGRNS